MIHARWSLLLLLLLLLLGVGAPARAQDVAPVTSAAGPTQVHIGMYLLRVDQLDLKAGSATITFYVWTRWPADSDVDGSAFEVLNGIVEVKDNEYLREKDGLKYAYYRCRAVVNLNVDFRDYPFDAHELVVEIEHAEAEKTRSVYVIDHDAMKFIDPPARAGWIVGDPTYEVATILYKTNWGMIGAPAAEVTEYSRFRATFPLKHAAGTTYMKTFLSLFISMLITFLAFLMHPEELEARVGVGVAGIFGAVTSQLVLSDSLPEISYSTLAERVHTLSLFFVFATLLATTLAGWLARSDQLERAKRIDRRIGMCVIGAYVVVVIRSIMVAAPG